MHAAAKTSVGQCTPRTRREKPTRKIHKEARTITKFRALGWILSTQRVAAVEKVATARVCPLGKLAPQYHSVSQSDGLSRATKVLIMIITSAALICEAAKRRASGPRLARSSNMVAPAVKGNRNFDDPVIVAAEKNGVRDAGICEWINSNTA